MELGFLALAAIIVLVLIGTTWQLYSLQRKLNTYNNYVGEVRQDAIEDVLSEEFLGQLRNQAQLQLTNTVKAMDQNLQEALQASYQKLLTDIEGEAAKIINGELEQYRQTLAEARTSAANVSKEAEKQLLEAKESIQKEAQAAIHDEKQQLLEKLDNKLSDIVTHYLVEALGEHVDLGSQKDYILSQLEAHKEEIKQDINDEF